MLSIIIPTYNEEKFLPGLLASIKEQSFRDFEIIVADKDSVDKTRVFARKFGAKIVGGGNPASGRNEGAKVAKGEWLLFLDADVILPTDFLKRAMAEIKKRDLGVTSCLVYPLSDKTLDKFLHKIVNGYRKIMQKISPRAAGFCIFIKKELHQLIGGFNEKLKLAEDHDYVIRASKVGKFSLLQNVLIPVSVRRLDKDGRLKISLKYLAVEAHLAFLGPIYSNFFNYKFGYPNKKIGSKRIEVK
jgi:glycosyltransferase involved in cell wall biosynthesis